MQHHTGTLVEYGALSFTLALSSTFTLALPSLSGPAARSATKTRMNTALCHTACTLAHILPHLLCKPDPPAMCTEIKTCCD